MFLGVNLFVVRFGSVRVSHPPSHVRFGSCFVFLFIITFGSFRFVFCFCIFFACWFGSCLFVSVHARFVSVRVCPCLSVSVFVCSCLCALVPRRSASFLRLSGFWAKLKQSP